MKKEFNTVIKFERLKCKLCKRVDSFNITKRIVINAGKGEDALLKETMVRLINRHKTEKVTCPGCGYRIELKKAKNTLWSIISVG